MMEVTDQPPSNNLRVPVKVRSNELAQLQKYTPRITDELYSIDEEHTDLEDLCAIEESIGILDPRYPDGPEFAAWVSLEPDRWQVLIRHLGRAEHFDGLRAWYLRTKLADRVKARIEEVAD